MQLDEERIRAIYSVHVTRALGKYQSIGARGKIFAALTEEYNLVNLRCDEVTKHFARTAEKCEYCNNGLFYIG